LEIDRPNDLASAQSKGGVSITQIHYIYVLNNYWESMNFTDLRTFLAVADAASFSAAAEQLHLTQPAVSKRIQSLEAELDVKLFDRVGKRVYLTQAGTVLVPQANNILAMLADTEKQLHNLSENITGVLHLATSHHIGLHRLAPVLREFTRLYPDVQLNIAFEDSEVAHDLVRQGVSELAVVTLNPAGDRQLHYTPVWHDPLVFVSAEQIDGAVTMQEVAQMPCVLPGTGTYTGRIVVERFADEGLTLTPTMSTNYLETIGMLVSVGLGWSVLPRSMVDDLHIINVACPTMARTLGHVINPARSVSNAATAFMAIVSKFGNL
jgi:DNA-binding transcriptional LysR family regulator